MADRTSFDVFKTIESGEFYTDYDQSVADLGMLRERLVDRPAPHASREAAAGWRGMDSAPRDGTVILATSEYKDVSVVSWVNGSWHGWCDGEMSISSQGDCYTDYHEPYVTHWMPISPAPGAQPEADPVKAAARVLYDAFDSAHHLPEPARTLFREGKPFTALRSLSQSEDTPL